MWLFVVHTAYKVMSEEIVKVLAAARAVPPQVAPGVGCVVHQPLKVKPVLTSDPVFPRTVTVAPLICAVASVGAIPLVGELELYVTV